MSDKERVNILLVDDHPGKLLSYEVMLQDLDETLIKAQSGREALEQILRNDIAVVLLDVVMPDLDGFELATMIRDHPRYHRTAIIFVSAISVTDLDRVKGFEHGAVDYIPVPVVPDLLRARVRVFAELYRKTRQLEQLNADLELRVRERTADLIEMNALLEQRVEERTREREAALAQVHEMQKIESLGQLTGGLAHDFNNLLMGIMGCLNYMSKKRFDDPRAELFLAAAKESAERGAALTKRLLAFARRQELQPKPVNVTELLEGMRNMIERAVGPTIRVELDVRGAMPNILVDPNQLELAILNLCLNARDAMPDGGSVGISAAVERDGRTSGPGEVRLSVEDAGTGMDEATLKRCAEPFFTTKEVGKGTGLGLSSVQGMAIQSGGRMKIDSTPGRGTVVDLWFPISRQNVTEPAAGPEIQGVNGRHFKVLVVDDDALVGNLAIAMLEELGHSGILAHSGEAALRILESGRHVDLVLTDHAMPEMTGAALAAKVRRLDPQLPIILASGFADIPSEQAKDFRRLSKPYSVEELAAMLAAL